jgi:hypothetical protein
MMSLMAERNAMQRPHGAARFQGRVALFRLLHCAPGSEVLPRFDAWLEARAAGEAGARQVRRRKRAFADAAGGFAEGQFVEGFDINLLPHSALMPAVLAILPILAISLLM